ncbi:MAG: hypothetical protein ACLQD8_00670 [Thermoplasmata archaeon]
MAERSDPRKPRYSPAWNGAQYPDPPPIDDTPDRLLPIGPIGRFPLAEAARPGPPRVFFEATASGPSDARAPAPLPPTPPQGLYDLPALLARIWSVPAAKQSTSGSYISRPEPVPPGRPNLGPDLSIPERQEVPPAPFASWPAYHHPDDPSLPLAAVPSLTLSLPGHADSGSSTPPFDRRREEPTFSPATQYVAWRHPPCRLAYDLFFPRGMRCLRGLPAGAQPGYFPVAGRAEWVRRDLLMRPATPGSSLERTES